MLSVLSIYNLLHVYIYLQLIKFYCFHAADMFCIFKLKNVKHTTSLNIMFIKRLVCL